MESRIAPKKIKELVIQSLNQYKKKRIAPIDIVIIKKNKHWIEQVYLIKIRENVYIGLKFKDSECTGVMLDKKDIINRNTLTQKPLTKNQKSLLDLWKFELDSIIIKENINEKDNIIKQLKNINTELTEKNIKLKNELKKYR